MNYYQPSNIEYMISRLYKSWGILKPDQLDIHNVASKLKIKLVYSNFRSYAYEDNQLRIINLQKSLPKLKQREVFYHELCHLLRHAGDQTHPYAQRFRDQQESEAAQFVLYALIPYHMVPLIDLSGDVLKEACETFNVTEKVAYERLIEIKDRMQLIK